MKTKRTGYTFISIGIIIVLLSLTADVFGLGKGAVSATQLMGVQAGVILALIGAALLIAEKNPKSQSETLAPIFDLIRSHPIVVTTLAGFLASYLLSILSYQVFNERIQFQYFDRYLPDAAQLGLDIREIFNFLKDRLTGQNVLDGQPYPPLFRFIFAPLILFGYPGYFYLITVINVISYIFLTFFIPIFIQHKKYFSLTLLFFVTGLFSYGWVFELERGQFNIITIVLCFFAVYLFHYHKEYRHFAYLFFSISVQLKIYPLIFIVMFIRDWRDWKNNLQRMVGLGIFNFALLFVMGYDVFIDWFKSVTQFTTEPPISLEDHSIKVFIAFLANNKFNIITGESLAWLQQNIDLLVSLLFAWVALCLLAIIIVAYRRNQPGLNRALLLACTLGSMLIPSLSYDYKLAILGTPMLLAITNLSLAKGTFRKAISLILIFISTLAYATTLISFKYRPILLYNSAPLLFVILTAITILYLINNPQKDIETS